jgi:hypothetical protein
MRIVTGRTIFAQTPFLIHLIFFCKQQDRARKSRRTIQDRPCRGCYKN